MTCLRWPDREILGSNLLLIQCMFYIHAAEAQKPPGQIPMGSQQLSISGEGDNVHTYPRIATEGVLGQKQSPENYLTMPCWEPLMQNPFLGALI